MAQETDGRQWQKRRRKYFKHINLLQKCRDDIKGSFLQSPEHFWHQRNCNTVDMDVTEWIAGLDRNKLSKSSPGHRWSILQPYHIQATYAERWPPSPC